MYLSTLKFQSQCSASIYIYITVINELFYSAIMTVHSAGCMKVQVKDELLIIYNTLNFPSGIFISHVSYNCLK